MSYYLTVTMIDNYEIANTFYWITIVILWYIPNIIETTYEKYKLRSSIFAMEVFKETNFSTKYSLQLIKL